MYQTVGQDAVSFVASAFDVPLYRAVIKGAAIDVGSDYGSKESSHLVTCEGDETEDLHALLSVVKVGTITP